MNQSQSSTTLVQTDFTMVDGPAVESGDWNICPTIDPASLVGPGRGAVYIYDSGLPVEDLEASPNAWHTRLSERGRMPGDFPGSVLAALAERFGKLVTAWKSDVRFLSDVDQICSHPAYQEIIGMGTPALPFIFAELEQEPDNWFWALKAITGVDPIPEAHRGNAAQMAADWLAWGQAHLTTVSLDLRRILAALGS